MDGHSYPAVHMCPPLSPLTIPTDAWRGSQPGLYELVGAAIWGNVLHAKTACGVCVSMRARVRACACAHVFGGIAVRSGNYSVQGDQGVR